MQRKDLLLDFYGAASTGSAYMPIPMMPKTGISASHVISRTWAPVFGITEKPVLIDLRHFQIPVLKLPSTGLSVYK